MTRVFWDTNLFIYLFEGGTLASPVRALRARMMKRGDQLCTSTLTLGELLVKPHTAGPDAVRDHTDALRRAARLLPFDDAAALHYAAIRGDRTVKPPDAIQLACAAAADVDLFITNDDRLSAKIVPGVKFITSLEKAFV